MSRLLSQPSKLQRAHPECPRTEPQQCNRRSQKREAKSGARQYPRGSSPTTRHGAKRRARLLPSSERKRKNGQCQRRRYREIQLAACEQKSYWNRKLGRRMSERRMQPKKLRLPKRNADNADRPNQQIARSSPRHRHVDYSPTNGINAMNRARLTAAVTACWLTAEQPLFRRPTIFPCRLTNLVNNSTSL